MTDLKLNDPPESLRLSACFGGADIEIDLRPGQHLGVLLDVVALQHGLSVTELIIVREGHREPLDHNAPIGHDYPHRRRHHVHHRKPVNVAVHYQAFTKHGDFPRQATCEQVLDWAIGAFTIDPSMADEFELALAGHTEELPLSEHIGHLAHHCDTLELNLVRGEIANGGYNA
jgi:hypothetical protein